MRARDPIPCTQRGVDSKSWLGKLMRVCINGAALMDIQLQGNAGFCPTTHRQKVNNLCCHSGMKYLFPAFSKSDQFCQEESQSALVADGFNRPALQYV